MTTSYLETGASGLTYAFDAIEDACHAAYERLQFAIDRDGFGTDTATATRRYRALSALRWQAYRDCSDDSIPF